MFWWLTYYLMNINVAVGNTRWSGRWRKGENSSSYTCCNRAAWTGRLPNGRIMMRNGTADKRSHSWHPADKVSPVSTEERTNNAGYYSTVNHAKREENNMLFLESQAENDEIGFLTFYNTKAQESSLSLFLVFLPSYRWISELLPWQQQAKTK